LYLIHSPFINNFTKEQKILYLGDWCIKEEDLISNKNTYDIIPHPFSTIKRKNDAIKYCNSFYKFSLPVLSNVLNEIHGTKEDTKYWKIIFGSWLIRYIEIYYERYMCISNAKKLYPDLKTIGLSSEDFQIPKDTTDFILKSFGHHYNFQLYTTIIKELNINLEGHINLSFNKRKNNKTLKNYLKELTNKAFHSFTNSFGSVLAKNRIWVSDFGIYGKELMKFVALSNYFFWPMYFNNYRNKLVVNNDIRSKISKLSIPENNDEFTRIFFKSLSSNMPIIFLEGYNKLKEKIISQYPKAPKAIISTNQWFFNDYFKILSAEMQKYGTKLFVVQHGGVEGIGRYESEENHLVEICDKYFMWGKKNTFNSKIESIASPKLSSYKNYIYNDKNKYILYVNTSFPDYTYVLHSQPLAGLMNNYIEWQFEFFNALDQSIRKLIIYRIGKRPTYYNDNRHKKLIDNFSDIKLDNENFSFNHMLKKSKLAVIDSRQTTYIEALLINHPVILFWNQEDWEVRAEVEPYFNNLIDAGILYKSPSEAAKKLESVYKDPKKWWKSAKVQSARNNFVARFANTSKSWENEWINNLGKKVKENLFD